MPRCLFSRQCTLDVSLLPKQTQPVIQVRKKTLLRIPGSNETDILNSYPKLPNNSQTFVSCLFVHPISCSRSPWNRIVAKESGCRWSWAFHATTNEKCGSLCAENQGCVTLASDITAVSLPKRDVKNANDFYTVLDFVFVAFLAGTHTACISCM